MAMGLTATVLVALAVSGDPVGPAVADRLPDGASGAVAAARGDRLLYCRGFGRAAPGTPATCDTVFDIGSVTKQFTAAAILELQQQGKLRVTERVGRYTIHELLTHTSGLPASFGGDDEPLTREALLARAAKVRLRPGYRYSNVGYSVLAAIVEERSGMGYEAFLRRYLFRPAGMTQTGYVLPDFGQVAVEYDKRGRAHGTPLDHPWAEDGPYWNLRGNGGLLSTARDMYRWHVALRGNRVLDRRSRRALFTPYVREEPGGDTRYAYGWVIQRTSIGRLAWHNGGNGRSYAEFGRLRRRGAMVFWATNRAVTAKALD